MSDDSQIVSPEDVEADYFSSNAFEHFGVPVALGHGLQRFDPSAFWFAILAQPGVDRHLLRAKQAHRIGPQCAHHCGGHRYHHNQPYRKAWSRHHPRIGSFRLVQE